MLSRGKVHEIMYNKVINRAECLKNVATNINDTTKIFNKTTLDSSFTQDNYDINTSENSNNIVINQKPPSGHNSVAGLNIFYKTYGIKTTECFKLTYDKNNHTFKLQPNELIGIPIDKSKGIKVDRIFVDKSILDITSGYWPYIDSAQNQSEYSKYIQNIIEVLIENFPNGDIRIIDGQNFEIIKTEDFIKTYVQDKDEKNFYLSELEKKRESMQQHKEEQMITSKYQEDTSLHTSHNKEVDNQQKRKSTQNKEEQIITSKDLKDISLHTSHNNEIDNQQKRESTQNKEEQIITSKYQEDTSLHTSHNKENISMAQQKPAMDDKQKECQNIVSNNQNVLSTVRPQTNSISETIINSNNTNTNENNKNNNESDWYLCSRWKQCWERCW